MSVYSLDRLFSIQVQTLKNVWHGDLLRGWGSEGACHHQYHNLFVIIDTYQELVLNILLSNSVKDPCSGDSGGPLMIQDHETARWTIIGSFLIPHRQSSSLTS